MGKILTKRIQGVDVPALGFGTWQLRGRECIDAVGDALELGYRHIDTAQAYQNEAEVGHAISESGIPREELWVTTKVWRDSLSPADVDRTTRGSLDQLQMDYVDLLLIHWPNDAIALEQTLDAMVSLREKGLVKHVGVSNFPPALVSRAQQVIPIFCNQVEYHPLLDQSQLCEMAAQNGFLLTAYSPIARGKVFDEAGIRRIAERLGKSPAQVALRWLIQQDNVAAIPKAASAEHRRVNLGIFDFELDLEDMEELKALSRQRNERLISPSWAPAW